MLKRLLIFLLQRVLILIALVVASAILPIASFWLVRDPVGGQVFFWVAPWTCAFWSILACNLIGSKFWRGREAVEEWRACRGGYLRSVAKGTVWMFALLLLCLRVRLHFSDVAVSGSHALSSGRNLRSRGVHLLESSP